VIAYPITRLTYKTGTETIDISVPNTQNPAGFGEACNGFDIQRGGVSDPSAPLVFVPQPETGLACVQAQEQTAYDIWLSWEGADIPRVLIGDAAGPLPQKHSGRQAYITLNWGNYVGASVLRVQVGGREVATLPVEVRSRKVGYLDDYRAMLNDISERLAALVFDFGSPTSVYAPRQAQDRHVAYLDYLFLRYIMHPAHLPLHFRLVAADPHHAMVRESEWRDLSQARALTPYTVQALVAHSEHLTRPRRLIAPALQARLHGHAPCQVLDERVVTTVDTPPNRFVKHFLAQLSQKAQKLAAWFEGEARGTLLAEDCMRWRRELDTLTRAYFLEEVGALHLYPAGSQVLLKRDGYRQLNDYYRRFLLTGKVTWPALEELLKTPSKDMATLYEYWCFFQLLDAVADALEAPVNPHDFMAERDGIFSITLDANGRSRGRVGEATVSYNRYLRHHHDESYSVTLHPDYMVEFEGRRFVFDAKYKYDHADQFMRVEDNADEEPTANDHLTYKRDDLYKMHTYRDALKAQAVFMLYPGNEFRAYRVDGIEVLEPEQLSPSFAGVGAIAIRMGNANLEEFRTAIRQLLMA